MLPDSGLSLAVILDTNIFVAAGFRPRSHSARILAQVRSGKLRMIWHEQTRAETAYIVGKIPPLHWENLADLFQSADRWSAALALEPFGYVRDPTDQKYAALAAVSGAILITNDVDLLEHRAAATPQILQPYEFMQHYQQDWVNP